MKVAWLTDIHLNFVSYHEIRGFCSKISENGVDAVLISGDIAEGSNVLRYLEILELNLQKPIYFVLGNHDYYDSNIAAVQRAVLELVLNSEYLRFLPACGIFELSPDTCVVGHGGWGDGRLGNFHQSTLEIADTHYIHDFAGMDKNRILQRINQLGEEAADFFAMVVPQAFLVYRHALILTHVPPFREACFYKNSLCNDHALPFFACKAAGDAFLKIMQIHPDKKMTVLCGHTHTAGKISILPNLTVHVGNAVYGAPEIQQIFEFEE